MKVLILGAGVVGVTSAYYLAKQGHEVTVLDHNEGPALATSYANAGQVSFGYASPWAAPGIPRKALGWLMSAHPPLSIRPDGSLYQLQWLLSMWRNCTPARYQTNKERMVRIANYARECLQTLRADTGIHYEERTKGTLQLFREEKQVEAVQADVRVLEEMGVPHQLLTADELAQVEPALANQRHLLAGGLHLPNDETGDCYLFTQRLAEKAAALGVRFLYNENIQQLHRSGNHIVGVQSNHQLHTADSYLLCLGSWSRQLLKSCFKLPVYPLKGYSITATIANESKAPQSTLLDESYKIALTRFDQRIRVGGMAEVAGFDTRLNPKRKATLLMVLNSLFPGSYEAEANNNYAFWTGLRPKTPDSTPIIGKTPISNLYLNTGHGTLGWTMSCGSGQLIADIISNKSTAIRHDDLSVQRYL